MDYKPDVCKVLMLPGFVCHKGVFRIMPLTRMFQVTGWNAARVR
jgi:hypothetical protein